MANKIEFKILIDGMKQFSGDLQSGAASLEEFSKVNKTAKWVDISAQSMKIFMKPGLWEVFVATVNQGLPNRLIGPDEALAKLEEARLKGK